MTESKKKKKVLFTILSDYIFLSFFLSSYTVYGVLPDSYSKWMFSIALVSIAYFFSASFIRCYNSLEKTNYSLEEKKKIKVQITTYIIIIILFTFVQIIVGWNQYTITFRY